MNLNREKETSALYFFKQTRVQFDLKFSKLTVREKETLKCCSPFWWEAKRGCSRILSVVFWAWEMLPFFGINWNFLSNPKVSSRLSGLNLDQGRPREPAISIRVPIWAQAISFQFTSTAIIEYRPCFRHCTKQWQTKMYKCRGIDSLVGKQSHRNK